jgi:hypothetical protein
VALNLDNIFSSKRMGRPTVKTQTMIKRVSTGIEKFSESNLIILQAGMGQLIADFQRSRTGNTHNAYAANPWRSCYRSYGICSWQSASHLTRILHEGNEVQGKSGKQG